MNDQQNPYQTPLAQPGSPLGIGSYKPTWTQILFAFNGRIRRSHYWAGVGIQIAIMLGGLFPMIIFENGIDSNNFSMVIFGVIAVVAGVLYIWIALATQVKRWHDRNKSGWWVLIGFIPYIGGFWVLIECGCLEGVEPNHYGPPAE